MRPKQYLHTLIICKNACGKFKKKTSNILKASDRQKRQYDVRVNQHRYQTGDVVWLHTLLRVKQRSSKLQRNWDGPYFVTKVMSDVIYKIQKSPFSSRSS